RSSFDSLDLARLENYLRDILKDPEVPESRTAWITRLKALGLMVDGVTEEPVCTIAGLVLFGIKPRQFLKQAGLRLMFFDALDKIYQAQMDKVLDAPLVGRFQIGKTGKNLIDAGLIEKSLELMEPFITREPNEIDENFRRERKWLYPFEAIRELLINALAHRDWTRFVDVEIAGYQDRLEITSPGALPNAMTVEKMLAGQRSARNTILVEVLRDYGYVDARGMGIRTKVVPLIKEFTGAAPKFAATDDFFKSTVHAATVPENVPKPPKMSLEKDPTTQIVPAVSAKKPLPGLLLSLLKANPHMTYEELAENTGQNRKTVQRHVQTLKAKGLLRRIGGTKGGYWEVIE
ncbi:MAG: winged helix-turn-helix transcriptional regulator, partial [Deltaproteobacteria bacterium]|nr:winged helix-turn-helix transcriptional regulator [Deltaproteobacteria bacterium]